MVLAEEREGGRSTNAMLYSFAEASSPEAGLLVRGSLKKESERGDVPWGWGRLPAYARREG